MVKVAYYFKHDENARNDPKILQMRSVYSMEGYGLFWALVEKMRTQEGYKIPISGKYAIAGYASEFGVDTEKLSNFINDCVSEFGLFQTDGEYLWSNSLLRRMQEYEDVRAKNREAAFKRWQYSRNADALQAQCEEEQNKEEQNKEEETKEKNSYGEFENVKLSLDEYMKLVDRFGEKEADERIEELSTAIKSRRGYERKYKNHYATILAWARKNGNGGNNGVNSGNNNGHSTTGKKVTNPQNTGRDRTSQIEASLKKYGIG